MGRGYCSPMSMGRELGMNTTSLHEFGQVTACPGLMKEMHPREWTVPLTMTRRVNKPNRMQEPAPDQLARSRQVSHASIISETSDVFPPVLRTEGSSGILYTQKRHLSSSDSQVDAART